MVVLKCAYPHNGYHFGAKRTVTEKEAEVLTRPDPMSRLVKWVVWKKPADQLAQEEAKAQVKAEAEVKAEPVAPIEEPKAEPEAPAEEPKAEAPKPKAKGK